MCKRLQTVYTSMLAIAFIAGTTSASSATDDGRDMKKKADETVTGTVRLSDGSSVPGAEVFVTGHAGRFATIDNGVLKRADLPTDITTDDGAFSIEVEPGLPWVEVVAYHDRGVAWASRRELDSVKPLELTLIPWARIEGTYLIGKKPAAKRRIVIEQSSGMSYVNEENALLTDAHGRFVFERIRPTRVCVSEQDSYVKFTRSGRPWLTRSLFNYKVDLHLKPGHTHRVQLGGTGQRVIGQVVFPDNTPPGTSWATCRSLCKLTLQHSDISYPPNLTKSEKDRWYKDWLKCKARCGEFKLQKKGALEVYDVPPGAYRLTIDVSGPPEDDPYPKEVWRYPGWSMWLPVRNPIGSVTRDFVVHKLPEDEKEKEKALDLGILNLSLSEPQSQAKDSQGRGESKPGQAKPRDKRPRPDDPPSERKKTRDK